MRTLRLMPKGGSATQPAVAAVALLGVLLVLTGCGSKVDAKKPSAAVEVPLNSQMETLEWRDPRCDAEQECTSVVIQREVFTDQPALNEAVSAGLLEQLQGNGEAAGAGFEQLAKRFIAEAGEMSKQSAARWQLDAKARKLARHGNLVTIAVSSYRYSGGAHGMPATRWLNWDLAENRPVVLADILRPGAEEEFWTLAQAAHLEWQNAQNLDADFRENWPFARTDDFRLTDKGMVLLYGVYTLGPYAMGEVELTVPRDKLAPLLHQP